MDKMILATERGTQLTSAVVIAEVEQARRAEISAQQAKIAEQIESLRVELAALEAKLERVGAVGDESSLGLEQQIQQEEFERRTKQVLLQALGCVGLHEGETLAAKYVRYHDLDGPGSYDSYHVDRISRGVGVYVVDHTSSRQDQSPQSLSRTIIGDGLSRPVTVWSGYAPRQVSHRTIEHEVMGTIAVLRRAQLRADVEELFGQLPTAAVVVEDSGRTQRRVSRYERMDEGGEIFGVIMEAYDDLPGIDRYASRIRLYRKSTRTKVCSYVLNARELWDVYADGDISFGETVLARLRQQQQ